MDRKTVLTLKIQILKQEDKSEFVPSANSDAIAASMNSIKWEIAQIPLLRIFRTFRRILL